MAAGIVCVGGDGIFHETFNGILEARAAAAASTEPGAAELAALLGGLRLAHIPAGSTDAVACTLHGSRSPWTAAMHVCLGDSCPLDVLRVDTASTTKFASCIAGEWVQWRVQRVQIAGRRRLGVTRVHVVVLPPHHPAGMPA